MWWNILEVDVSASLKEIKKAYAVKIKSLDMQTQAEEFQRLKVAFDQGAKQAKAKEKVWNQEKQNEIKPGENHLLNEKNEEFHQNNLIDDLKGHAKDDQLEQTSDQKKSHVNHKEHDDDEKEDFWNYHKKEKRYHLTNKYYKKNNQNDYVLDQKLFFHNFNHGGYEDLFLSQLNELIADLKKLNDITYWSSLFTDFDSWTLDQIQERQNIMIDVLLKFHVVMNPMVKNYLSDMLSLKELEEDATEKKSNILKLHKNKKIIFNAPAFSFQSLEKLSVDQALKLYGLKYKLYDQISSDILKKNDFLKDYKMAIEIYQYDIDILNFNAIYKFKEVMEQVENKAEIKKRLMKDFIQAVEEAMAVDPEDFNTKFLDVLMCLMDGRSVESEFKQYYNQTYYPNDLKCFMFGLLYHSKNDDNQAMKWWDEILLLELYKPYLTHCSKKAKQVIKERSAIKESSTGMNSKVLVIAVIILFAFSTIFAKKESPKYVINSGPIFSLQTKTAKDKYEEKHRMAIMIYKKYYQKSKYSKSEFQQENILHLTDVMKAFITEDQERIYAYDFITELYGEDTDIQRLESMTYLDRNMKMLSRVHGTSKNKSNIKDVDEELTMKSFRKGKINKIYMYHPLIGEMIVVFNDGEMVVCYYPGWLEVSDEEFQQMKQEINEN